MKILGSIINKINLSSLERYKQEIEAPDFWRFFGTTFVPLVFVSNILITIAQNHYKPQPLIDTFALIILSSIGMLLVDLIYYLILTGLVVVIVKITKSNLPLGLTFRICIYSAIPIILVNPILAFVPTLTSLFLIETKAMMPLIFVWALKIFCWVYSIWIFYFGCKAISGYRIRTLVATLVSVFILIPLICYGVIKFFSHEGKRAQQEFEQITKQLEQANLSESEKEGAEQGNKEGEYLLGLMLKDGQGKTQNYEDAVKWLQKAAEQGDAYAQYELSKSFLTGQGVKQNNLEAFKWAFLANAQSYPGATDIIVEISANLSESQLIEAKRLAKEEDARIKARVGK